jgi:Ca2+-binding EF-hand superfamily protein
MIKSLIYNFFKRIAYFSLVQMYNWLDKNKDGSIDKKEIRQSLAEIKAFLAKYQK